MINEISTIEKLGREAKTATGQSGTYLRIFMGLHHVVVIYGPVRPDSYGVRNFKC
jgi:hypothetical protein